MTSRLDTLAELPLPLVILAKMTILLLAGWTLHGLLRDRNPRWRVLLWRGVMIGLILLPVLEVALPAMRVEVPAPALQIRYVTVPAGNWSGEPMRPYGRHAFQLEAYDRGHLDARAPSLVDRAKEHGGLLLIAGWSLVTLALVTRTLGTLWRVRRIVRTAAPAPQPIVRRLQRIAEDLRCSRHVGLRLTAALVSPFLARVVRPVILLPEKMASPARQNELDGVLAHELAHVRANDLVWLLLGRFLSCLLWFHPLTWRIAGAHNRACEEVCDAVAAEYVGGAPAYSGMLARVALELMADAPADGGVSMVRAATILQRVRLLKRGIQAAALGRRWIAVSLAAGCLTLLVLGSLKIAYAEKSQVDAPASTQGHPVQPEERKPVMVSIQREGGKVWVEGLVNEAVGRIGPQSQMRLMAILLKQRGETADARELLVLSGDAFHLCHPEHWQGGYSQLCIPTDPLANIARAYGYHSRWLNSNLFFHQINKLPNEQKRRKLDELHQEIGRQLEAGRPVLMGGAYGDCGSWRIVAGIDTDRQQLCYIGGDTPYHWVDIPKDPKVAQLGFWDEQVRGTIRDGFLGGWQSNAAFVLEDKTRTPSAKDRLIGALRLAVELYQDREHDNSGKNYLGRRAYEQWAHDWGQMSDFPDYQAAKATADPKAVFPWYSIDSMALEVDTIVRGRTAAADYLESHAGVLPEAAGFLKAAAAHYRREAALTKEAFGMLLSGDRQACEQWLADKEVRKAGGKAISQIMAQDEAAIREISKALAAEGVQVTVTVAVQPQTMVSKAKVIRQDGKVWIAGAETMTRPERSENTVMRSLAVALRTIGEDVSYEHMMGISGAAFRIQVFRTSLCPSSPHAHCGVNCQDPALAALPYAASAYGYPQDDPDGVRLTRQAIVESIDRGWPVAFGSEETGLIVGYADGGNVLLGRPAYGMKEPGFQEIKTWPWGFTILRPRAGAPDRHETAVESLKRAVSLANREASDDKRYLCGWTAYARWIDILENGTDLADVKPGDPEGKLLGNAFIYLCLWDARRCAAGYLRSIEDEFQPGARKHVTAAATIYEQIAARLDACFPNAPFPWFLKPDKPYTAEMRRAQAKTLREVCDLERKAIEELKAAVEAEEHASSRV